MVANMKIGKMDGFCVGEPWNARAIADKIGFTSVTTQDIWKDHPEKVCAFTAEFAEKNPKTVKAVLKALHEASVWLDDMDNRPEQCEIVSRPTYINCDKKIILGRLLGKMRLRRWPQEAGRELHALSASATAITRSPNTPSGGSRSSAAGAWSPARRTTRASPSRSCARDIYEEAMKEIGVPASRGRTTQPGRSSTA